jgi:DHA1 family inner membrane transport protein
MRLPRDAVLLGICLLLVASSANVLTPLLPLVQDDLAVDYVTAGLLVSSYGVARLVVSLPAGFLEQRLGGALLAGIGFVALILSSILTAVAPTFEIVVVGRVGMGLGACVVTVVLLTALSRLATEGNRARVMSVFPLGNNSAIGFFPIVGGLVGEVAGWRSTMVLCGVLACLSAALLAYVLPRISSASKEQAEAAAGLPKQPALGRATLLAIGAIYFGVVIYMINRHGFRNTALPLFAAEEIGLGALAIASGITLMAVVGLLVAIPGAALADRWSRRGVIITGFLVLALGDLAFLGVSSYTTFLLAALVLGLGDFFAASQTAALTEAAPPSWRGPALGAYRFSVDLGATIGPAMLAGLFQFAGFRTMIVAMAGLLLVAALGAWGGALAHRSAQPVSNP